MKATCASELSLTPLFKQTYFDLHLDRPKLTFECEFDLSIEVKEIDNASRGKCFPDSMLGSVATVVDTSVVTGIHAHGTSISDLIYSISKRFEEVALNIVQRKIQHTNNNQVAFWVSISAYHPEKIDPYYKDLLASFTFLMEKP